MINAHELKSQKGKYLLDFYFIFKTQRKADDLSKVQWDKVHIPQPETACPFLKKVGKQRKKPMNPCPRCTNGSVTI